MRALYFFLAACLAIGLTGCESVSMPYVMQTDRVDQKVEGGNRGYLKGTPPPPVEHTSTRPLIAVDVDLIESNTKATEAQSSQTQEQGAAQKETSAARAEQIK